MARYGKARRFEFEGATGTANEHADRLRVNVAFVYGRLFRSMGGSVVKKIGVSGKSSAKKQVRSKKISKWCRLPRACPSCGTQFNPYHALQKFCTKLCRLQNNSLNSKPKIRTVSCEKCGSQFLTGGRKRFCSQQCHRPKKEKKQGESEFRACERCGGKSAQKAASIKRTKAWQELLIKTPGECMDCGTSLPIPRIPTQKYCSKKCGRRFMKRIYDKTGQAKMRRAVSARLRELMRKLGKKKVNSIIKYLGCSTAQLKTQIESQFTTGMTWENYGVFGWHVDHILPLAKFDLTLESHRHVACHHSNLRPLWFEENVMKADKIIDDLPQGLRDKANMLGILTC